MPSYRASPPCHFPSTSFAVAVLCATYAHLPHSATAPYLQYTYKRWRTRNRDLPARHRVQTVRAWHAGHSTRYCIRRLRAHASLLPAYRLARLSAYAPVDSRLPSLPPPTARSLPWFVAPRVLVITMQPRSRKRNAAGSCSCSATGTGRSALRHLPRFALPDRSTSHTYLRRTNLPIRLRLAAPAPPLPCCVAHTAACRAHRLLAISACCAAVRVVARSLPFLWFELVFCI